MSAIKTLTAGCVEVIPHIDSPNPCMMLRLVDNKGRAMYEALTLVQADALAEALKTAAAEVRARQNQNEA